MKQQAKLSRVLRISLLFFQVYFVLSQAQVHKKQKSDNVVAEMQVLCHSDSIVLKVNTNTPFNGMLYAKDSPNNNNCFSQFISATNMTFRLPLKSCGTLFAEVDDGIEYFNTIVVQPHMRLMTNQGKGYHIRCKYQTRERTIANTHFNVSAAFLMQNGPQAPTTPLLATASMPSCTMKIFRSGRDDVAETVKIGDKLIMVIEIDQQDMYGMKITNCVVRDGMNMAEQQLINDVGCPVDENIMPKFDYSNNYTRAAVSFPAHKFPHTSSVYYQCNVRLCINNGGCDLVDCGGQNSSANNNGGQRKKRFVRHQDQQEHQYNPNAHIATSGERPTVSIDSVETTRVSTSTSGEHLRPTASASTIRDGPAAGDSMSFDVYSGLYVNDIDVGETGSNDFNTRQVSPAPRSNGNDPPTEGLCLTPGKIGLLVLLASLTSVGLSLMIVYHVSGLRGRQLSSNEVLSTHYPIASRASHYIESLPCTRNKHHHGMGIIS